VPALSSIRLPVLTCSVADPDTGSGAFVTPGSGMNILDHISESLETIFWFKIIKLFDADPDPGSENLVDPGSGMEKIRIREKHPGSATLLTWLRYGILWRLSCGPAGASQEASGSGCFP
jgi:hypothetical protein